MTVKLLGTLDIVAIAPIIFLTPPLGSSGSGIVGTPGGLAGGGSGVVVGGKHSHGFGGNGSYDGSLESKPPPKVMSPVFRLTPA